MPSLSLGDSKRWTHTRDLHDGTEIIQQKPPGGSAFHEARANGWPNPRELRTVNERPGRCRASMHSHGVNQLMLFQEKERARPDKLGGIESMEIDTAGEN
jgi:hypothetical protein